MERHARLPRADWRRGRAALRSMPFSTRQEILDHWNKGIYPADPCYLAGLLHELQRNPPYIREYHAQIERVKEIAQRRSGTTSSVFPLRV